jgi:hypothetical protein
VTITGTNLTGATAVTFGSVPAPAFSVVSATQVTATAPAGGGPVHVTVTTPGGTSASGAADTYTYASAMAPTITALTPASGVPAGGNQVAITGTNLAGATSVMFGTVPASAVSVVSSTQVTATAPAGSGTVDVTVTTPNGTSATSSADRYTYALAPPTAPVRYEESDSHLTWGGNWSVLAGSTYSGGRLRYAWTTGAWVTINFSGSGLTWIAKTGPTYGKAQVTVDNGAPVLVDLYTAAQLYQQNVWSSGPLSNGSHTVKIVWTGQKNPLAGNTCIALDAVDVAR